MPAGSSPRGRGKLLTFHLCHSERRLIPAWAGKTPDRQDRTKHHRAHPRVGGENRRRRPVPARRGGSSPRGRGKPQSILTGRLWPGLIPAWAGKTSSSLHGRSRARAHPRVGGENERRRRDSIPHPGSSPRGRGKHLLCVFVKRGGGLIPAWAGKTYLYDARLGHTKAHPRVGGENVIQFTKIIHTEGSSPRGRGKPVARALGDLCPRLIPAWAGKTCVK